MMNRLAAVMVVMVMGLTAFGAKAATDNVLIEVNVTIAGTVDLEWAAASVGVLTSGQTPKDGGANEDIRTTSDIASWTLLNPDFAQTHTTGVAPYLTTRLYLDNVGRKTVDVTARVPLAGVDTAASPWTLGAAPGISIFGLKIKAGSGTGGTGNPTFDVTDFTDPLSNLGPVTATSSPNRALVTGFKRAHNYVLIDLEYKTPTDFNVNAELDSAHKTTITLAGTAN